MTLVAPTTSPPRRVRSEEAEQLVAAKSGRTVAVCIPARNEEATIGPIVAAITEQLVPPGLVDTVVVVDDGSADATGQRAADAGARVVRRVGVAGKGQALRRAAAETGDDVLVFLDADVINFTPQYVSALIAPLLADPVTMLVKGAYERPLHGQRGEGGRVTELVARPLLERFFPALAGIVQPLAGEFAIKREVLSRVTLADGYAVDIAVLIDVYRVFGRRSITEAGLGERVHRNRPLGELHPHSRAVLDAVLARAPAPAGTPADEGAEASPARF